MKLRGTILTGALAAVFALAGASTAQARDNCRERIHNEEHKLQRDARKHGWNSRQARNRREKIHSLQRQCGSFFGSDRGRDRRLDRNDDWRQRDRDRGDWNRDRNRRNRGDLNRDRNRRDRDGWHWDGRNWRRR
jgi:hypothetical protein